MIVRDIFPKMRPTRTTGKLEELPQYMPDVRFANLSKYMAMRIYNIMVGLEIEVENMDGLLWNKVGREWAVTKDGSLRDGGLEFVTLVGTRMHRIPYLLECLDRGWQAPTTPREQEGGYHPVVPSFSERTSTHVHLDCRMLGEDNIRSLIMLYTVFEDALFGLCKPNRKFNVFAVPLNSIDLPDYTFSDLRHLASGWHRYSALNLHALQAYGTIEFRHMHGTNDPVEILPWMYMLCHMRIKAGMVSQKDVFKLLCSAQRSGDFRELAEFTFGPWAEMLKLDMDECYSSATQAKLFYTET